jgi:hypothetical protein
MREPMIPVELTFKQFQLIADAMLVARAALNHPDSFISSNAEDIIAVMCLAQISTNLPDMVELASKLKEAGIKITMDKTNC